ncbi:hypothetical protein [Microseira wollei]|uniref:hypothetical protein n=1 Tax=Microseira wollei TaxID=467598 RepID=UPI001CFE5876|nr:hypothetical protein [Microseira wollei]
MKDIYLLGVSLGFKNISSTLSFDFPTWDRAHIHQMGTAIFCGSCGIIMLMFNLNILVGARHN